MILSFTELALLLSMNHGVLLEQSKEAKLNANVYVEQGSLAASVF